MLTVWPTALCAVLLVFLNRMDCCKKFENLNEAAAANWLSGTYEVNMTKAYYAQMLAEWNHVTNATDTAANTIFLSETKKLDEFVANASEMAVKFLKCVKKFTSSTVKRQLRMISDDRLNNADNDAEIAAVIKKNSLQGEFTICAWDSGKQDCSVKWGWDEISPIFTARTDYDKIKYIWDQIWVRGAYKKPIYAELIRLLNRKAKEIGYKDFGAYRRHLYEYENLPATLERLWVEILPLYEQIHTYVRRVMRTEFPGKLNLPTIPMHLTNAWVQAWNEDPKLVYPYPKGTELNVTKLLLDKGLTVEQMYSKADDFVNSMGLERLDDSFWKKSYFVQPEGRQFVDCKTLFYEFDDGKDFREKGCYEVNADYWPKVHNRMSTAMFHIYVVSQPSIFSGHNTRNPIEDVMGVVFGLASKTAKRLKTVGLFDGIDTEGLKAYEMNDLMDQAFNEVVYGGQNYVREFWHWSVFNDSCKIDNYDKHYCDLLLKYVGIEPAQPIPKNSFIAQSDNGIQPNIAMLPAIVNLYLQYQLFEGLCNLAGYKGPLHQCDFYGSKAAGNAIKKSFKLGGSRPPGDLIKIITGQREISSKSLMRYFKPLYDWLKTENDKAKDCYGWRYDWPANVMKSLEKNRCAKK